MRDLFYILPLILPVAGLLYGIYRQNYRGRSLSALAKLRGMSFFVLILVAVPIGLFIWAMLIDYDPCALVIRRFACLAD